MSQEDRDRPRPALYAQHDRIYTISQFETRKGSILICYRNMYYMQYRSMFQSYIRGVLYLFVLGRILASLEV